ncbi:MAG: hypothetical protein GY757_33290 [bacterium]|nr:hypothetical protein [bacterium]
MKSTGKAKMVLKKATIANLKTEDLKKIQAGAYHKLEQDDNQLTGRPPVCEY